MRGVTAYGSAISRSVSLIIRFGNAAIVVVCCDITLLSVGVIGGFSEAPCLTARTLSAGEVEG